MGESSLRVLITGGAGFIGSHLADRLVSDGEEVLVFDDLSTGNEHNFSNLVEKNSLRLVRGDIRNPRALKDCLSGINTVVHLAGITSVSRSLQNPQECAEINVGGTSNILRASAASGVSRFVYASSSAVYGNTNTIPISEDHPLQAMSPYAASKISGEDLCSAYDGTNELETVCLRLFNVYGPKQGNNGYANVIANFLEKINLSSPLLIYGDGEQTRDFIHVRDVIDALTSVIQGHEARGTFNVGTGRRVTINYLAETILKLSHKPHQRLSHGPPRPGEVRHSQANIGRLKDRFAFAPKIQLEQGLLEMLEDARIFRYYTSHDV